MLTVVGIGAGGRADLSPAASAEIATAAVLVGSERQLALLDDAATTAERVPLPAPLASGLPALLRQLAGRRAVVLASGDPMFFGIGTTLVRALGAAAVRVVPSPSSVSLAAARLGWSLPDVEVVSVVGRPLALLRPALAPDHRVLVLTPGTSGARDVRDVLAQEGYAASEVTVLAQLGGPDEWVGPASDDPHDALAIVAVACRADPGTEPRSRAAALPDDAFEHDGQLTKQEVRAVTLAALRPLPGALLWDVGAGSGSVGIEWLRTHPSCRAVAIEPRDDRRERVLRNAERLGVPGLEVVAGAAPSALAGLPTPDAVFVGGGVSGAGVLPACVAALRPGGRLVANGVTVETETVLADTYARHGGTLTRLHVERASPVGGFTGWRPAMPVTQWSWTKPGPSAGDS
ncbi:precorrin-6Y C5,15-methyltransferase (decarboxylating) [Jatrophihabitans endophyticus]|uniref:Precorrin-6Y C5,15-methyltransferase (Decarboxylating) n=1 Tax=Jatrophihabitans endophyticus TaxID=1206085 RepID=A0A1M5Q6I7_9ACTN|nr:precorrin-6Y C5,15-methyltransferase (decarboxylating) [Jatrophihabitans endophyticus]